MIKRNVMRNNWIYIILTLIVCFSTISILVFMEGREHTSTMNEDFREFYIEEQKARIQLEVDSRYDEIVYEEERLQIDHNLMIQNKIKSIAYLMANSSFSSDPITKDKQDKFLEVFDEIVENESDDFFVLSPEGLLLRSSSDDVMQGKNISQNVDSDGVHYGREIMSAVDSEMGIYVTYRWPKIVDGEMLQKTSFCLYLKEYDLIIGTGAYEVDLRQEVKDRTYNRLLSYYEGKDNYVFVNGKDGIVYVHGNHEYLNTNFSAYTDDNGLHVHGAFLEAMRDEGYGYVTYQLRDEETGEIFEKTSYVRRIEDWDAYIGMGFQTEELDLVTDSFVMDINEDHTRSTVLIIAMLIFTSILLLFLFTRGSKMQSDYMKQEDIIYEQVLNMANDLILVISNDGRVLFMNRSVPDDVDLAKCIKRDSQVVSQVEEHINVIHGSERDYYIESKQEDFFYHGQEATIYFIKDITEQYEVTNEMKTLALHDALTGLPNRRKFAKDMEVIDRNGQEVKKVMAIAMIDIDHFKMVNDTYGHDFGDVVLTSLADYVKGHLRETDSIYRYGGEEFLLVLQGFNLEGARDKLEMIKNGFTEWMKSSKDIHVTFSGGMVIYDSKLDHNRLNERIKRADEILYKAKNEGRNRILSE